MSARLVGTSRGVRHRVRQFLVLSRARPTAGDDRLAGRHLHAAELGLWRRQSAADRAHSVRVLRRLLAVGEADPVLIKAALLHDVGKSLARVTVLDRVALVLLQTVGEPWLSRLANSAAPVRGDVLDVLRRHPTLGAELARSAGCGAAVVDLIARHDGEPGDDRRLRRLRWADRE